jgi:hypothetical protein
LFRQQSLLIFGFGQSGLFAKQKVFVAHSLVVILV